MLISQGCNGQNSDCEKLYRTNLVSVTKKLQETYGFNKILKASKCEQFQDDTELLLFVLGMIMILCLF